MLHAVIMAGGSGTRFWPQSRRELPKQLLKLAGDRTMIQQTLDRCDGLVEEKNAWVVTNARQADRTREQLPGLPPDNVLVEPAARNTAPCIGLAAIHVLKRDPEAVMFVMPADHVIQPTSAFQEAARTAVSVVERDPEQLVLFGVPPTYPATGFGYIEREAPVEGVDRAFRVQAFREKPDPETAEDYVQSGNFYWNCGIFCWKAATILKHLEQREADTYQRLCRVGDAIGTDAYAETLAAEFPEMNSISIDYAILEQASEVTVIEAPYEWDDAGSWLAVPRLIGKSDAGNTVQGLHVGVDTTNCIIRSTDDHLVATLGVDDLIVVHTSDATLVARREDSERVKEILNKLRSDGNEEYL